MSPRANRRKIFTAHRFFLLCAVMLWLNLLTVTRTALAEEVSPPKQPVLSPAEQTQAIAPQEKDVFTLPDEEEREKKTQEIQELTKQLLILTQENEKLKGDQRISWFIAGGGVLFVGWLLGLISCRARKRKPSLL